MLLFFDGFENYSNTTDFQWNWSYDTSFITPVISTNGGFGESRAILMNGNSGQAQPVRWRMNRSFEPLTTMSAGLAIKFQPDQVNSNNLNPIMEFNYNSSINICVYIKYVVGGGFIPIFTKAFSNNSVDFIATGQLIKGNFKLSNWHYYELELNSSVDGFAKFYVDGNLVLELNNYNFTASGTPYSNVFRTYAGIYYQAASVTTPTVFDNFYLTNQPTRIGQINVQALRPSADTLQKDWVPSTGTANYSIVNKIGLSSNTNVSTMTEDATDFYEMADLVGSANITNIIGIKTTTFVDKNSYGDTNINLLINNSSEIINLPNIDLFEQRAIMVDAILENDPSSDSDWTVNDVNTLQLGITSHLNNNIFLRMSSNNLINGATGSTLVPGDTPPTTIGDALVFTGSELVRYTDSTQFHITDPYSIEFDFMIDSKNIGPSDNMNFLNIGWAPGNDPELAIVLDTGNNLILISSANGSSSTIIQIYPDSLLEIGNWYRLGIMFYNDGSNIHVRSYINGYQRTDDIINQPWNSTAGLAIGNTNHLLSSLALKGKIRNLRIGQSLFWKI